MKDTICKTHPDAPHSFNRNASLSEDRYVCDCEYWEPPTMNEINFTAKESTRFAAPPAPNVKITFGDTCFYLRFYDKKIPNAFQRWLIHKCFGVKIERINNEK